MTIVQHQAHSGTNKQEPRQIKIAIRSSPSLHHDKTFSKKETPNKIQGYQCIIWL